MKKMQPLEVMPMLGSLPVSPTSLNWNVGDEDACVLLDHDLRRFDDLGFAEASRKREGDDHQG